MRIKNNPKIFYMACGLIAEGDRRYDKNDAEIAALADKVRKIPMDDDILQWFNLAKTGQVDINPYWPRGHAMLIATLFVEEDGTFNIDQFLQFLHDIKAKDPVGEYQFRIWIAHMPKILTYVEGKFRALWKEYCEIIFARMPLWMPEIEASRIPLKEFFGASVPKLVLTPNLFASPFAADFVRREENTVIVIACKPDVESMLHEALHTEIVKCRDKFKAFGESNGLTGFANLKKMKKLGYMQKDNPTYIAHVIEECFVRALSIILAGGGESRLKMHVGYGFTGLPAIAKFYDNYRPTVENLGDFVDAVLKVMASK